MNAWIDSLPGPAVSQWIEKYGERAMEVHRTEDPHFALWLHYLDRVCRKTIIMSYQDLEDWDYWSAYEGGMSPKQAALDMMGDLGYGGHWYE